MRVWVCAALCAIHLPLGADPGGVGGGQPPLPPTESVEDRLEEAWALGGSPDRASAAAGLAAAAKDPDARVRRMAAASLGRLGKGAPGLPALLELMRDPDAEVRWQAVWALDSGRPEGAGEGLARALEDPDEIVRLSAAAALHGLGRFPETLPALRRALSSPEVSARGKACELLGGIPDSSTGTAAALALALADPEPEVREAAAGALERLGPPASSRTIAALAASLKDADALVRMAATRALGRLRARERLAELAELLGDRDPEVREAACAALRLLDSPAAKDCSLGGTGSLDEADELGDGALRPGAEPAQRP